ESVERPPLAGSRIARPEHRASALRAGSVVAREHDQRDAAVNAERHGIQHEVVQTRVVAVHAVKLPDVVATRPVVSVHLTLGMCAVDVLALHHALDATIGRSAEIDVCAPGNDAST